MDFTGALRLEHAGHDLDVHDRAQDGDDSQDRVHWGVRVIWGDLGRNKGSDDAEKS